MHELADASGAVIRPYFRVDVSITDKTDPDDAAVYDPVTEADRNGEMAIRNLIRERYPRHAILGEEHGREGEGPELWVLDPIDGTRSFIGGFPTWGTLIAFNDGEAPLLGVMDQPVTGERFVGTPDGAFLAERKLHARGCRDLDAAVLYATTPDMFSPTELPVFEDLAARVQLRRFGGDCYAYCMLAMGLVDLVVESALQPYDIQALVPIVRAAGGVVTTWEGGAPDQGGRIVAAGDPRLHEQVLTRLAGV
jgi:myo-inositol-1(or 4)-monophosphatase